jgi:hypothetical protein
MDTINSEKSTYRIGENVVHHMTGKRLTPQIYKNLLQLSSKEGGGGGTHPLIGVNGNQ